MALNKNNSKTTTDILIASAKSIAPAYDALSNAPGEPGSIVYITGAGTDASGLYVYNAGWIGPFAGSTGSYTDEMAQDAIAAALIGGTGIGVTYDDVNNSITIDSTASAVGDDVYLNDYASDPTGGTASDTALDNAIADCDPGDTLVIQNGTFLFDATHVISKPLTIHGENATITRTVNSTDINEDGAIVFRGGGVTASSALSANVAQGDNDIPVTDASLFTVGEYVYLFDNGTINVNTANAMTFGEVTAIDTTNNIVTMSTTARHDFSTVNTATLFQVDMLESPRIEGMRCEGDDTAQTSSWFKFDWCVDSSYADCHVNGFIYNAFGVYHSWRHTSEGCSVAKPYANGSSAGEAFQFHKTQGIDLRSPRVVGDGGSGNTIRRGIDFHKSSIDAVVTNPQIEQFTLSGVSTHDGPVKNIAVYGGYVGQEDFANVDPMNAGFLTDGGGSLTVDGTEILAGRRGVTVTGGGHVTGSNLTITPRNASANAAIRIEGGSATISAAIVDPAGDFTKGADVDGNAAIDGVTLDLDIESGGGTPVHVHSSGADVSNVTLSGRLDSTGTGDAVFVETEATGETVSNVTVDGFDIVGAHAGRGVVTAGTGTVEYVSVRNSHIDTASGNSAGVDVTNTAYDALSNIRVEQSDFSSGTAAAVQVNDAAADGVRFTAIDGDVSVVSGVEYVHDGDIIVKSGSVALTSSSATVDTGVATTETATFDVYLAPSSADAQLAADIVADSATGTYVVGIQETDTNVGNPTCEYDIVRRR